MLTDVKKYHTVTSRFLKRDFYWKKEGVRISFLPPILTPFRQDFP